VHLLVASYWSPCVTSPGHVTFVDGKHVILAAVGSKTKTKFAVWRVLRLILVELGRTRCSTMDITTVKCIVLVSTLLVTMVFSLLPLRMMSSYRHTQDVDKRAKYIFPRLIYPLVFKISSYLCLTDFRD